MPGLHADSRTDGWYVCRREQRTAAGSLRADVQVRRADVLFRAGGQHGGLPAGSGHQGQALLHAQRSHHDPPAPWWRFRPGQPPPPPPPGRAGEGGGAQQRRIGNLQGRACHGVCVMAAAKPSFMNGAKRARLVVQHMDGGHTGDHVLSCKYCGCHLVSSIPTSLISAASMTCAPDAS